MDFKYGSVITGFHDTVSADGMNEAGVVCNLLYQVEANYGDPKQKERATLSLGARIREVHAGRAVQLPCAMSLKRWPTHE